MEVLRHMLPGKKFSIKLGITVENEPALSGGKPPLNKIKGKYIVLHPVSGCPAKDWAIENYAELASRFAKKMPVYIIGAGGDKGIDSISGKNIHNTAGSLSIRGIASLIKGASLVIGNDSAAVHMAAALGTKSLTIFSGSALYGEWGAYGKNAFILTKDVPCRECGLFACDKPLHECMDISEGEVEKAAVRVLSGRQKSRVIRT
jgi:ADP-heptose:LPS heptosyltransferase